MKIGLFTDTAPPLIGGIETVTSLMEHRLKEQGHEVYTFAPAFPRLRGDGPNVYRLPSVCASRTRKLRLAYALTRSARRATQDLEIVHSHTPFTIGWMGARIARARGIPHVYTHHFLVQEYRRTLAPWFPKKWIDRWFKSLLGRCDLVLAPSSDARNEVESFGVPVPVGVLPFGPNKREFDQPPVWDARTELGIAEPHLLLFVGRLVKEKNIAFVLRSFGILAKRRSDVHLVLVGDGPSKEDLQRQAKELGVQGRTTFCGFLIREKVVDLYRQADLFVFGSKTETQGLVVLEAMMGGTPPVAVDGPGVREMVRSGTDGFLVPEDEKVFASCCEELLENPDHRKELGLAAKARAQELSAQAHVARLVGIYQDLLRTRSRSAAVDQG